MIQSVSPVCKSQIHSTSWPSLFCSLYQSIWTPKNLETESSTWRSIPLRLMASMHLSMSHSFWDQNRQSSTYVKQMTSALMKRQGSKDDCVKPTAKRLDFSNSKKFLGDCLSPKNERFSFSIWSALKFSFNPLSLLSCRQPLGKFTLTSSEVGA